MSGKIGRLRRRYVQVSSLLFLIRQRERGNASLASLGTFPLAVILDLIIGIAFERDVKNHGEGNHLYLFELLHCLLFFSYVLLIHLQESSEIIQKTSAFPISLRTKVTAIAVNTFGRFPTIALIVLSRLFFWLRFSGPVPAKIAITGLTTLFLVLAGFLAATASIRLAKSPRVLACAAGAGVFLVLAVSLPFWG